jgi:hypothetical protein
LVLFVRGATLGRRRDEGFPNPPEGNPNFFGRNSKENRKEIQGKLEGNPSICLPRIEPFQGLAPTPWRFLCLAASRLKGVTTA